MLVAPPQLIKRRECRQRKNQIISVLLNNYETETASGDNITIDDCIQAPIKKIKIYGKQIKQEIGDNNEFDETEIIENMAIIGNANSEKYGESEVTNITGFMRVKANTTYYFEYEYESLMHTNSRQAYFFDENKNFASNSMSYNPTSEKLKIISPIDGYIRIAYDKSFTNIKFYEEEYIFYPSPKKESKLEYIEGNQEIERINENLFKGLNEYIFGINSECIVKKIENTIEVQTSSESSFSGVFLRKLDNPSKTELFKNNYFLSFDIVANNNCNFRYGYVTQKNVTISTQKQRLSIEIQNSADSCVFYVTDKSGATFTLSNFAITNAEKEYIPHNAEIFKLTNLPAMYSEKDCIVKLTKAEAEELGLDGAGDYVYNEWEKYIVTGDEEYSKSNNIFTMLKDISLKEYSTSQIPDFKSNMFVPIINNTIYSTSINLALSTYIATTAYNFQKIVFKNTETSTIEEFKNWIKKLYICIIYPLKVPKYTKITDEILIEQLEELRKMVSSEGTNHFIVTSEDGQVCNLEVTAYKNSIKIMQKEIYNLKELVLNNIADS